MVMGTRMGVVGVREWHSGTLGVAAFSPPGRSCAVSDAGGGSWPSEWRSSASAAHSGTNRPAHATGDVRSCVHDPSISTFAQVTQGRST